MKPCTKAELQCARSVSVTESDCLASCEGIILGVRRHPVERHYEPPYLHMLEMYENYKCSNYSKINFDKGLSGKE